MGGAASGKSQIAEDICHRLCKSDKLYIATMAVNDAEGEQRVQRHRAMRKDKGFHTVESKLCQSLAAITNTEYNTALLECLSNLLANEMFIGNKAADTATCDISDYIENIRLSKENLIVVTNDIFGEHKEYDPFTKAYITALATINKKLAHTADAVIEAVCGIPIYHKGDLI